MSGDVQKCSYPAAVRFTWPGQGESRACLLHAGQIDAAAKSQGVYLQLIPLTQAEFLDDSQCRQEVKSDG